MTKIDIQTMRKQISEREGRWREEKERKRETVPREKGERECRERGRKKEMMNGKGRRKKVWRKNELKKGRKRGKIENVIKSL